MAADDVSGSGDIHEVAHLVGAAVSVVVLGVVCLVLLGHLRRSCHRAPPATGDRALAKAVDSVAGRHARRLAVAVVDLRLLPTPIRSAHVDCGPRSLFEMGSISKGLTGLLIADAAERNAVDLDAPIATYLTELAGSSVGGRSLRELCTHTAGLPRLPSGPGFIVRALASSYFGVNPYGGLVPQDVIDLSIRARPTGQPGYSNLGAALAGQVVARAEGAEFSELLSRRIFGPLGMTRSTASGEPSAPRGWRRNGRRSHGWAGGGFAPAGGVVTSLHDLTLLTTALLQGRSPGQAAIQPSPGQPTLFWVAEGGQGSARRRVWHNGETGGYSAQLDLYPGQGRAVIVLSDIADSAESQRIVAGLTRWLDRSDPGTPLG